MTRTPRILVALLAAPAMALFLAAAPAAAQEEPADATAPPEGAQAAPDDEPSPEDMAPAGVLEYVRGNFRDPFRSLEERQKPLEEEVRPPGPAGMLIEEIDLVGVLAGPKGTMVLIIGPDGLGYSLTEGADLYDGKVLRIDAAQGVVVFRQEVNDPNRIKPYRDIERRLDTAS